MRTTTALIEPSLTMGELLKQFPGAQRALFRRYHIGGCSSCGFRAEETLAEVCTRNENLPVEEVIQHVVASDSAERAMQIEPQELAEKIRRGDRLNLLDIRTREEFEAVRIEEAQLFTQDLMQEILSKWSRQDLLAVYDHTGEHALDAAAYFQGHDFKNVKVLRGGIDAWSKVVDSTLPRYHLEQT